MPGAETAREAVADHVEALERERQGDALRPARAAAGRRPDPGRPRPPRATSTASGHDAARSPPFSARPQPNACDAVPDERHDRDEAGDRAGGEPERGRPVVVERRERARGDTGVDLRGRRRDEPGQQLGRLVLGARAAGQHAARAREARRPRPRRPARAARRAPATTCPPRARAGPRPRARANSRQHDHPQRVRDQHERDVDRVGGEEAVGLYTVPKLARENGARDGRRTADRGGREPGQDAASNGAPAGPWITLHRCRATIPSSGARPSSTSCAATSRDVYEGRTCLVTGADGFMGSHLTDALVEIGAEVIAFVRATSSGALNNIGHLRGRAESRRLRRPDRQDVDRLPRCATSSRCPTSRTSSTSARRRTSASRGTGPTRP